MVMVDPFMIQTQSGIIHWLSSESETFLREQFAQDAEQ